MCVITWLLARPYRPPGNLYPHLRCHLTNCCTAARCLSARGKVREDKRGSVDFDDKDPHLLGMFFDSFVLATFGTPCIFINK